ncbi:hypothetical protein ADEAN_000133400 [Angomonas deanei]|uniref:Uncharacterized protein n=1 Tax=Angomonas deanei TaxID=59799 RepID=A0A7G2C2C8_9TRYP|nr:hypothetical protein ADEAN_000133400 [Angomonas deanei]
MLFHAQTCELFWRNDELKPVPDSMSHFTDFETILGKELLQCGLVSRHEYRHWVHIVGTTYDVVEWSKPPSLENQGVHQPVVIAGIFPKENIESAVFDNVRYDRIVDVMDDTPWPVRSERWAVELLKEVLQGIYHDLKFLPIAPAAVAGSEASHREQMRFIMCDGPQYPEEEEQTTWKEVVAFRYPRPFLEVYNLVPHARKVYRSLVYTTCQLYCLHSMPLVVKARSPESLRQTLFQAGDMTGRIQYESTIEIYRYNEEIGGREVYVPPRLLQGTVPSALLESFTLVARRGQHSTRLPRLAGGRRHRPHDCRDDGSLVQL